MPHPSNSCPSCGARVGASDRFCDLCGTDVSQVQPSGAIPGDAPDEGIYCNECGWKNPGDARFCSRCGERLQVVESEKDPVLPPEAASGDSTVPKNEEGIGRQVALLVGGAVMVVLALYLVTLVSKQNVGSGGVQAAVPPSPTSLLEEQAVEPLSADVEQQADELREAIARASGTERREHQRHLVDLLFEAGRADLAAIEAQYVAEETGDAADWRDAGDLYFQWMESSDAAFRADLAHLVMFSYEKILEQNPDNHDVRANVAWAAQYDASDPMRAIEETNYVLEREPDHVQANFNRGYFLMRINRFDQAANQMERVLELSEEDSPVGRQAAMLIQIIREEQDRLNNGR